MIRSQFPEFSLRGGQQRHLSVLSVPGSWCWMATRSLAGKPCAPATPGAHFPACVMSLGSFAGGVTGLWGWRGKGRGCPGAGEGRAKRGAPLGSRGSSGAVGPGGGWWLSCGALGSLHTLFCSFFRVRPLLRLPEFLGRAENSCW